MSASSGSERKVHTVCPLDCWDACGMIATVADGRVVRLEGDPDHPIARGVLCTRTYRYPERVYSSERILYPMKRAGEVFEPTSWDEALSEIANRLDAMRQTSRTLSLLHVQSAGSMGVLKKLSARFWNLLGGVTVAEGDFCLGAGKEALERHLGDYRAHEWDDIENSRLVILWGRDPYVSGPHRTGFLKRARERGARIISINPLHLGRSKLVDETFRLRPGTDHLVALALARILMDEERVDRTFIADHTEGFERFEAVVRECDLGILSEACGITVTDLRRLARSYADADPAAILFGTGAIRYRTGVEAAGWVTALPALLGYYGRPGGGLSYSVRHLRDSGEEQYARPNPNARRREVSAGVWAHVLDQLDPPIEALWVNGANPVAMLPGSPVIAERMRSLPFKVVVDFHWTDTARLADWVLPHPSFLEEDGLVSSWGHHWLGWQQRAVAPLGESRTDLEIFQGLADRLGFGEEMAGGPEEWSRRLIGPSTSERDWESLRSGGYVRNPVHEPVPYADRKFARASGRYLFPSDLPPEDWRTRPNPSFPYLLLTPKSRERHLSQTLPALEPEALRGTMASDVARTVERKEGNFTIRSKEGQIPVWLREDPDLLPGLIVVPVGGRYDRGTGVNLLTGPECASDGVTAAYFDLPVSLTPA